LGGELPTNADLKLKNDISPVTKYRILLFNISIGKKGGGRAMLMLFIEDDKAYAEIMYKKLLYIPPPQYICISQRLKKIWFNVSFEPFHDLQSDSGFVQHGRCHWKVIDPFPQRYGNNT